MPPQCPFTGRGLHQGAPDRDGDCALGLRRPLLLEDTGRRWCCRVPRRPFPPAWWVIGKGGPCILLRADMDGLPMEETTGLDFAAKGDTAHCVGTTPTRHATGGAASSRRWRTSCPAPWLMFQPGEEMGYGSRTMVEDGLLENPRVDAAMALHVGSQVEVGKLNGVASGAMATFIISIQGKGGHSSGL
ncbi:MAG: M20/M25/M40 family metallo-hydrolase [Flavonifractor plautii]